MCPHHLWVEERGEAMRQWNGSRAGMWFPLLLAGFQGTHENISSGKNLLSSTKVTLMYIFSARRGPRYWRREFRLVIQFKEKLGLRREKNSGWSIWRQLKASVPKGTTEVIYWLEVNSSFPSSGATSARWKVGRLGRSVFADWEPCSWCKSEVSLLHELPLPNGSPEIRMWLFPFSH